MRETEIEDKRSETEDGLMERGKLKLLILLDLQPIKIYHTCLHVGKMLFF